MSRRDLLAIVAVAVAVLAVTVLSTLYLPVRAKSPDLLAGRPWWEGWVNWDSGWYRQIALTGYTYTPGRQGPVPFFPLYPLLMRMGGSLVGSVTGPGVLVTLSSGVGAAVLLSRWLRERLSPTRRGRRSCCSSSTRTPSTCSGRCTPTPSSCSPSSGPSPPSSVATRGWPA